MKYKYFIFCFFLLLLFAFPANANQIFIEGSADGDFVGYAYNGEGWTQNSNAVNGLTDVGYNSAPTMFYNGNILHLISGESGTDYHGYEYTIDGWVQNITITNGLVGYGFDAPHVFTMGGLTHLISAQKDSRFAGYDWNGTGWQANATLTNGISTTGFTASVSYANFDGNDNLIVVDSFGESYGYDWNGTGWQTNATLESGIESNNYPYGSCVLEIGDTKYLVQTLATSAHVGYIWTGSTWAEYTTIVAGLQSGDGDPFIFNVSAVPPVTVSPYNGELFTVGTAPYTEYVEFVWAGHELTSEKYNVQISTDPGFQSIVKNFETAEESVSYYLYKDEYYWRVRSYDYEGEYGDWSETSTFTISVTPPATIGNNIYGVVYESTESGYNELENAIVAISNDTYYDSLVTASTGYYFFNGLANSSTYYLVVTKDGYEDSQVVPVTTGVNESVNKDILLQKIEGEGQYYENHYVRFIVTDKDLSQTYDANLKMFVGESTTAKYDKNVGVDGAASFLLDQQERYRIETTYDGRTQTDYVTPSETEYYIFLEWIDTGDTFLPHAQFYDDVNITVSKNDDTGVVTVYYNDSLLETNSLTFQIGQVNSTNDFVLIEESVEFIDTDVETFSFAALTNYVGGDYQVRVLIDHDSFGTITKKYGVSFPGSNLPFGRGIAYLCVLVLLIVGMQFSEKDANSGAILICGLASLMWYMDIFEAFGSGINTLMGVGLGMAVFYSVLKYINDKRMTEGL